MSRSFVLFVTLFVLGLTIRAVYEQLKKARRVDEGNRPVFFVVFTGMVVLWVSWFAVCPRDPFHVTLPVPGRWAGLAVVVLGWVLALGALAQLRGVEHIDHLVTTGVFFRLRHPMYTGFVLWIVGWAAFHGAVASLVPGLIGIVNIIHWRRLEEERLGSAYGESYRAYRHSTWF